jgi:hypothetical protein
MHHTLIIQEFNQVIKLKQHNINYINQIRFIKLLCDDCHKQAVLISKSRDNSNRFTPYKRKLNQHVIHFSRSVHIWPSTIYISHGPHIATFHEVVNSDEQRHCSREKWLPTQSTVRRLTDPWVCTQFLSRASHWSNGGKITLCWRQTTRLNGPIYQHVIGTFNTCSRGQPIIP